MRRWLAVSFLIAGLSFTALQTLMIRELLVSFAGNELAIGLVLGSWLVLQALGSAVAGRFAWRIPPNPAGYAIVEVATAFLLLPSFWLALHVRSLVGAVPGEVIALLPALGSSLLALSPVGLLGGASFALGCRILEVASSVGVTRGFLPAGRVYVLEAAGSIAGGTAATYLFFPHLTSTQTLLLLAGLHLGCAMALFLASSPRRVRGGLLAGLLGLASLALLASPLGPALHRALVAGRWAPYPLAYEGNSAYGNVAVIAEEGQITLYASGSPVLTAPDYDVATVEQLVHLPALFLGGSPRRALVIGGGAGGVLYELERYPLLERLDYAELDPLLIHALAEVPTTLTAAELADPRLHLALEDGRRYVAGCAGPVSPEYDLIFLNLPPPTTLELNRLYTVEFLAQVRPLLSRQGLLVLPAPPARTYMSPAERDLLVGYARTLEAVFPQVRPIPSDDLTLWLAAVKNPLDLDAAEAARRLSERAPALRFLHPASIPLLLDPTAAAEMAAGLAQGPTAVENRDGYPSALRYALAYESARLSPGLASFFQALGRLRWWHAAGGIAGLTLAGLLLARRRQAVVPIAVATTGLAGMAADILVILTFQVLYGYVYQQVGLLVTAFMAGLSLGGLGMTAWVGRLRRPWRALVLLELAGALATAGLAGGLFLLLRRPALSFLEHGLLLAANAAVGALVGLEFPLANHLLLAEGGEGSRVAGALYAWDLLGATVGAVTAAAVLLPALGLVETALLVALLKGGSLLLVGRASRHREQPQAR